ncbi:MAG: hypothetical protein KDN20_13550, partial [Verrucomicrobiae bacterium]|nr:hypothetical protein [Verrucomicrobiae bacterium]
MLSSFLLPMSRLSLGSLAFSFLILLSACGPGEKIDSAPSPPSETEAASPLSPAPSTTDPVSEKIEAFTGGHTKLAWARYTGGGSDVFANYDKLQLWGIDTRDGLGIRPILEDESNYSRPIILPDGSGLVFSNKGTIKKPSGKKVFSPAVFRVDWNGENLTELASGYATDVWRDPATGTDWVYATDLLATDRSSIEGSKLERFPLNDPAKRETVWDKTRVSTENVQLSLDGARASCLFPWPDAGVLNLETMKQQKYQHGCWPSMSPDSSHHAWVFDGSHKNLVMFTDGGAEQWTVPVNTAPGASKHEMYHPRWSNHVRYLTITGPYSGETVTRSDSGEVEVYVGKFSADLKQVEDWLQVTDDESGDLFPDLWIAGGELASVGSAPAAPATADSTAEKNDWPIGDAPRLFVWKNRDADNAIDAEGTRESSVEAKGRARFGPHFEMLTDGGHFEMDEASAAAVEKKIDRKGTQPFTVELLAIPSRSEETGDLFRSSGLTISQLKGQWVSNGIAVGGSLGPVTPNQPSHLAVVFDGKTQHLYLNGKAPPTVDEDLPLLGA